MNRRIKILFIEGSLCDTVGGAHKSLFALTEALDSKKYEKTLLYFSKNEFINDFQNIGIHIISLEELANKKSMIHYVLGCVLSLLSKSKIWGGGSIVELLKLAYNTYLIVKLIKKNKIDIVHCNNGIPTNHDGILAAFYSGIPSVCHERGQLYYGTLTKLIARLVTYNIFISNTVKNDFQVSGVKTRHSKIIYNGVKICNSLQANKTMDIRHELNISKDIHLLGMIGNFVDWKGHMVVVEMVSLLKNDFIELICLFVGGCSNDKQNIAYYDKIINEVKRLGLEKQIIMTGYRRDVFDIISSVDVLINASTKKEPFGRTIIEGMAANTTIVAPNSGGPAEIIENDQTGLLFETGNSASLANAVKKILINPDLRKTLSTNARKKVIYKYSIKQHVHDVELVYQEVLGKL